MDTKSDDSPLVIPTTTPGLLMVESRRVQPGAFWPVQQQGMRYQCMCPAARNRRNCAHVDAAWAHTPLLTLVDDDPWDSVAAAGMPAGSFGGAS